MTRPTLSVIIPVYNASLLLERCLDSVFTQNTKYSFNVILIDDGSTDDTVEIIKARKEQDRIILYQQNNSGPATARNKGVELSDATYCTYLDADDYWNDGYIEKTIDFLNEHNECIAVTVGQKYLDNGVLIKKHPDFLNNNEKLKECIYAKQISNHESFVIDNFYSFWREWEFVGTCSTVIRRDILTESGGQRSDLRICEDMEFWPFIASFGKWGFIPDVLYVSDGGAIVSQQGWSKYVLRFQNVPMYDTWFKRLSSRLTPENLEILKPVLNGVVCGHSRAMISGGDYKRSYDNLSFFYKGFHKPYPVRIHDLGYVPYLLYAITWRLYQYLKINKGVIKKRLGICNT